MHQRYSALVVGVAVTFAATAYAIAVAPERTPSIAASPVHARTQSQTQPGSPAARQRALVNRYCVTCHNQRAKAGGLALDDLDVANVGEHPEIWEKAVQKLHGNLMPPAGRPRPDQTSYNNLISYLETSLDKAAELKPDPGRTEALHRLNRAEYRNAVRDLLALDIDVSAMLPADDVSYGFDNIAGVQRMSPTLMERYLAAARRSAGLRLARLREPRRPTRFSCRRSFARTIDSKACRSAPAAARRCATTSRAMALTVCACS